MNRKSQENLFEDGRIFENTKNNPLVHQISGVLDRVKGFKDRVKQYYFEVMLSGFSCPICDGNLRMIGPSKCHCVCGNELDPTIAFQKSACCGSKLVRKTFHYACARCHKTVASRFLFDEKVFDKNYFREMMREYRDREKNKKEAMRLLLAESKSGIFPFTDDPNLEAIPDLIQDLNDFIQVESSKMDSTEFNVKPEFRMDEYRDHINFVLYWDCIRFTDIDPIIDDFRSDKIWRFITLIFMENNREIELMQDGSDIWVQRFYHETHG